MTDVPAHPPEPFEDHEDRGGHGVCDVGHPDERDRFEHHRGRERASLAQPARGAPEQLSRDGAECRRREQDAEPAVADV